ncbi:Frap1 protein, partial [Lentinula edodes]
REDIRQDERVMQLFSLVNGLLSNNRSSCIRRLHIQCYSITPLIPNAGLLGMVQDCDTLHALVRDYRESKNILVDLEHRLMLQMAPDYANLTTLQKVEVFEYALENTSGQDLHRVLWLKSQDTEHWLTRRVTYTRTLAVNSMIGYILGLGDRHPSNILLERTTGKIIHCDFGDCFEVTIMREKFPETVPFRLTRMMTHAMEVSGIEGDFRTSSEITMEVLRNNKESVMAVLEALVYDPLISWRLEQVADGARQADETVIFGTECVAEGEVPSGKHEDRNERAVAVYERVKKKLTEYTQLAVEAQVDKLIRDATSIENLSQLFLGWCAFW